MKLIMSYTVTSV